MPIRPPTEQDLFIFVSATHACDKINVPFNQITATWKREMGPMPNPHAHGHFRALNYILNTLIDSVDFPAKEPSLLKSAMHSDQALFWLRNIHTEITMPLVTHPMMEEDANAPTKFDAGRYRYKPANAVTKPAPPPELIRGIMHNWLVNITQLHHEVKGKIDNPYGVSQAQGTVIHRAAYETNLLFCIAQPFACYNQRLGRLVENALRLNWRLPLKNYSPSAGTEYSRLVPDLEQFQNEKLDEIMAAAKNVKGM